MNIIEALSTQRKGKCIQEAQEKLQEVVRKCTATGKKGKLVIRLNIDPGIEEGVIIIKDNVTGFPPEADKASTSFYSDANGNLHREDPRQPELPSIAKMDDAVNQ